MVLACESLRCVTGDGLSGATVAGAVVVLMHWLLLARLMWILAMLFAAAK